jgi:hypothetical protein
LKLNKIKRSSYKKKKEPAKEKVLQAQLQLMSKQKKETKETKETREKKTK